MHVCRLRTLCICVVSLFLVGCASSNTDVPTPSAQQQAIATSLDQAAQSVASSLAQLAAIKKAQYPNMTQLPLTKVDAPPLNKVLSLNWYGPIETVLQTIASKTGYQLQVYGKAPKLPILVRVDDSKNLQSAITLLRNIDLQAGLKASIDVFAKEKIISLRYMSV